MHALVHTIALSLLIEMGVVSPDAIADRLVLAALIHVAGVMVSRWLFFAEAKHTVTLYYGQRH